MYKNEMINEKIRLGNVIKNKYVCTIHLSQECLYSNQNWKGKPKLMKYKRFKNK